MRVRVVNQTVRETYGPRPRCGRWARVLHNAVTTNTDWAADPGVSGAGIPDAQSRQPCPWPKSARRQGHAGKRCTGPTGPPAAWSNLEPLRRRATAARLPVEDRKQFAPRGGQESAEGCNVHRRRVPGVYRRPEAAARNFYSGTRRQSIQSLACETLEKAPETGWRRWWVLFGSNWPLRFQMAGLGRIEKAVSCRKGYSQSFPTQSSGPRERRQG